MSRGPHDDRGGEAVIETVDGHAYIKIRVPVSALPGIVEFMADGTTDPPPFKVVDPLKFARSLVNTLNEPGVIEGPVRIHEFFDRAIVDCWENGDAEGVEDSLEGVVNRPADVEDAG